MLFKIVLLVYFIVVDLFGFVMTLILEDLSLDVKIVALITFGVMFYLSSKLLKTNWKLYRTGEYKEIKARKKQQRDATRMKQVSEKKMETSKLAKGTVIAGGAVTYAGFRVLANLTKKYK